MPALMMLFASSGNRERFRCRLLAGAANVVAARKVDLILVTAAWLLLASGLTHAMVWLIAGGPWEGSTTWRKPILFGLSGGATLWSVGWVWSKLPAWRFDIAARLLLALSIVAEVSLITAQIWMGRPSHFNRTSRFDALLDDLSLCLISLAVGVLTLLAVRCWGRINAPLPIQLAIRAGMAFLLISCGLGYCTSVLGYAEIAAGRSPELYGSAGVLKFPHGACLHAAQTLPLLGWLLNGLRTPLSLARMRWWVAAHAWFLIYAVCQTLAGRPRWDINLLGMVVLLLTTICAVAALRPGSLQLVRR